LGGNTRHCPFSYFLLVEDMIETRLIMGTGSRMLSIIAA
jgi:hypothetical protein